MFTSSQKRSFTSFQNSLERLPTFKFSNYLFLLLNADETHFCYLKHLRSILNYFYIVVACGKIS